jgi:hypothetical protein
MTRRTRYTVELYAALPYTVEVLAATREDAVRQAEHFAPIPPRGLCLPALFVEAVGCVPTGRRRKRGKP